MKQSLQGWRMPKTLLGYANAAVILKGKVNVIDKSLHSCCLKKRLSYPLITTLPKCHVQPEACFLIGFTELDWIMTLILGWWDLSANQRSCCIMLMTRVQSLEPTMKKSAYSWRLSSDLHKTHTFFFFLKTILIIQKWANWHQEQMPCQDHTVSWGWQWFNGTNSTGQCLLRASVLWPRDKDLLPTTSHEHLKKDNTVQAGSWQGGRFNTWRLKHPKLRGAEE